MFTGLVEAVGLIRSVTGRGQNRMEITISSSLEGVQVGESISVSGVCVTVTEAGRDEFSAFISSETYRRSKLGRLRIGDPVNLERALRAGDRLGGHIVQGHVDEVGRVVSLKRSQREARLQVEHSGHGEALIVDKGSVCVDGVSLTVTECSKRRFTVSLIPYTLERTSLGRLAVGEMVNLEFDVLAKYVLKCLQSYLPEGLRSARDGITIEFLREEGFV